MALGKLLLAVWLLLLSIRLLLRRAVSLLLRNTIRLLLRLTVWLLLLLLLLRLQLRQLRTIRMLLWLLHRHLLGIMLHRWWHPRWKRSLLRTRRLGRRIVLSNARRGLRDGRRVRRRGQWEARLFIDGVLLPALEGD